ncbi:6969_t:CDS:2 [Funneliformis geosporum]|nr:6969_t:CDS:2 [Funneliformis geosporum]
MPSELQIKTRITEIKSKTDKNGNPYGRLTLHGLANRYFYAFSNNLKPEIFTTLTTTPYNFINRQVLITYQELPNQDNQGTFKQKLESKELVEFTKELKKYVKERKIRDQFLHSKFQEISDLELIAELEKRTQHQAIKLSMYSGNNTIFIEGKDIKCEGGNTLPIEIKEKDPHVHRRPATTIYLSESQRTLSRVSKTTSRILKTMSKNQIENKLQKLNALYNLVENLRTALTLLEDQPIKGKADEFGQPLTEAGLCSLVDEYNDD